MNRHNFLEKSKTSIWSANEKTLLINLLSDANVSFHFFLTLALGVICGDSNQFIEICVDMLRPTCTKVAQLKMKVAILLNGRDVPFTQFFFICIFSKHTQMFDEKNTFSLYLKK